MAAKRNRKKSRKNPTLIQWTLIGVGAVAVGVAGYGVYHYARKRRTQKVLQDLPPPPNGTLPTQSEGAGAPLLTDCGESYPGFVFDGDGCAPTSKTPGGIYVAEECEDFVFVAEDKGPQLEYLEDMIDDESSRTQQPGSVSSDPTELATDYFEFFWGECTWPPPPSSSERIVHLYQAIAFMIGNLIVADGGRVLGTNDPDLVEEQVAQRLQEMGYDDFDPDVVPEIKIPDALPEPPTLVGTRPQLQPS